jgi:dethiobiotin synthetase
MTFDGLRPQRLVVVVGTGTEIGKTYVTARLLRDLRSKGIDVAARKPAQSFGPEDQFTDAHFLADASGESPHDVSVEDLASEIQWPLPAPTVAFVESAGGVRSPLASDGDSISLIEILQPDIVLLVADAGLGTINQIILSLEAINSGAHVATPIVVLNRFDPADDLHKRNRDWLTEHLEVDVLSSVPSVLAKISPL